MPIGRSYTSDLRAFEEYQGPIEELLMSETEDSQQSAEVEAVHEHDEEQGMLSPNVEEQDNGLRSASLG